jgi:hypothetical protein
MPDNLVRTINQLELPCGCRHQLRIACKPIRMPSLDQVPVLAGALFVCRSGLQTERRQRVPQIDRSLYLRTL